MKAVALVFAVVVPAVAAQVVVEPRDLGFRIVRRDNVSGHHEAVEIIMSSIMEMDDDGVPVGAGATPPHNARAFDNISISSGEGGGYRDGIPVEEVSLSATTMGGNTTVTVVAAKYFESGRITTMEPSSILEVGNETIRIDVQVSDWPFCTLFGQNGGRECPSEPQDILLEAEGALPAAPTAPPPHTLLIPRCEEETLATFRFVCDPRLTVCTDLASVKFYLGEADQPPGQAPNTATIQKSGGNGSTSGGIEDFQDTGVYEHNLTRAEVTGFLNVTSLTPGLDYVFWSVWEHNDGSAPESNSQSFDLSRTQYWQCPGTTIDRNFEVGTSLSFSFVVDGPSSLTAVCNDSASSIDPSSSTDSSSVEASDAAAVRGGQSAKNTPGGRLLLDEANGTMFQTFCNNHNDGEGVLEARWRWGAGGATFALGELSRIRLASDALLDGLWSSVREAFSTVTEEGEITASVELFESRATFSTLLFYDDVATVEEGSSTDFGKVATWVAVAFCIFLVWLLGCCRLRLSKDDHAARTWPAAVARATVRSLGGVDDDGASSFGSEDSDIDDPIDVQELQIFPMAKTPSEKSVELPSQSWTPGAAPMAGCTTPGSAHSTLNLGTRHSSSRGEAFALSDAEASPTPTDVPSYTREAEPV